MSRNWTWSLKTHSRLSTPHSSAILIGRDQLHGCMGSLRVHVPRVYRLPTHRTCTAREAREEPQLRFRVVLAPPGSLPLRLPPNFRFFGRRLRLVRTMGNCHGNCRAECEACGADQGCSDAFMFIAMGTIGGSFDQRTIDASGCCGIDECSTYLTCALEEEGPPPPDPPPLAGALRC